MNVLGLVKKALYKRLKTQRTEQQKLIKSVEISHTTFLGSINNQHSKQKTYHNYQF